MDTMQTDTMQPGDEKWLGLIAGIAASVVPQVISAIRRKDFAPDLPAPATGGLGDGEEKWIAQVVSAVLPSVISTVPQVISAIRRKDFAPDLPAPATGGLGDGEEKWGPSIDTARIVMQVINAIRRKDLAFAAD